MFDTAVAPFVPPQFGIKLATEAWEVAAAHALRVDVFCREQRLFVDDDRDAADAAALTIVAVDYVMGMTYRVVGTVRIHEASPGVWSGSRLAIDAPYRGVYGLGRGLVYRAVTTARARGCTSFTANVQRQNVDFFARLGWDALADVTLHGHPHTRMRAELHRYPPALDDDAVAMLAVRRAS